MSQHARPHLETHNRGAGHSAIAGAAYRLGLRLLDRRTGQWHDYRRRQLGEEIVRALTVAPEGAPAWATDPGELWARAEAAEKRKDAQVARDYRIPIPFGLTDQQAGDLAEEMARYIAEQLTTAVSLGLHRDGELDALGALKPPEKQGFHAHLYFPTRKLEELEQGDGTSAWGLGAKLMLLSNRNSSGAFVERLNAKWAELSNRYAASLGLTADYDHRSYVRQDLPLTPQPTLGAAVTAMERRGFFTRRGDALRGDIVVPSFAYEAAHTVVLDVQRKQAVEDAIRERSDPAARTARLASEALSAPSAQAMSEPMTAEQLVQVPLAKPPLIASTGSLVARYHAAAPLPTTLEERQIFFRVLKIVSVLERVIAALNDLANKLRQHAEGRARRMAAKLDTDYQLDGCRAQRASAREKVEQWEANHKWQIATMRAFGGANQAKPRAWQSLIDAFDTHQRRVQVLKASLTSHQVQLDALAAGEAELKAKQNDTTERLRSAMEALVAVNQAAVEPLMSVIQKNECELIKAYLPEAATTSEATAMMADTGEAVARLRPAARRVRGSP